MQNSDYRTAKAGNEALTCLETILNPHTPGYHTNWPAWKTQIAGFGWEWQSQILHQATDPPPAPWQGHGKQMHPRLTLCPPSRVEIRASSSPERSKKVGRVSLSLCVWERDEHRRHNRAARSFQPCHPKGGWGEGKWENPPSIIIHGSDCPF